MVCVSFLALLPTPSWLPSTLGGFLFETQILGYLIVLITGLLLAIFLGVRRQNTAWLRKGLIIAAVAVVWGMLGWIFDTPSERLQQTHTNVLSAVQNRDIKTFAGYIHQDFAWGKISKDALTNQAAGLLARTSMTSFRVLSYQATLNSTQAVSSMEVSTGLSSTSLGSSTLPSTWTLQWRDGPDGWQLTGVTHASFGGQTLDPSSGSLPLP
jgi:hypothetical protein